MAAGVLLFHVADDSGKVSRLINVGRLREARYWPAQLSQNYMLGLYFSDSASEPEVVLTGRAATDAYRLLSAWAAKSTSVRGREVRVKS